MKARCMYTLSWYGDEDVFYTRKYGFISQANAKQIILRLTYECLYDVREYQLDRSTSGYIVSIDGNEYYYNKSRFERLREKNLEELGI